MSRARPKTQAAPLYEPRREMLQAGWLRILTPSAQLLHTALYAQADPRTREVVLDYGEMDRVGLSRASVSAALTELIVFGFVRDTGRRVRRRRILYLTGEVPELSRMAQLALANQWVRRLVIAYVSGEPIAEADRVQIERRLRSLSRSPIERYFLHAIYTLPPAQGQSFREVLAAIMPKRGESMREAVLTFPSIPQPAEGAGAAGGTAAPPAVRETAAPGAVRTEPEPAEGDAPRQAPAASSASVVPSAPTAASVPTAPAGAEEMLPDDGAGASAFAGSVRARRPLTPEELERLPKRLQEVVQVYNYHSPTPFCEDDLPALWEAYRQCTPAHIKKAIVDVLAVPDEPDLSRCKTEAQRETARRRHEEKRRRRDRFTGEFAYFLPLLRMYGQSRKKGGVEDGGTKGGQVRVKHPAIQRLYPDRRAVLDNIRAYIRRQAARKDRG